MKLLVHITYRRGVLVKKFVCDGDMRLQDFHATISKFGELRRIGKMEILADASAAMADGAIFIGLQGNRGA